MLLKRTIHLENNYTFINYTEEVGQSVETLLSFPLMKKTNIILSILLIFTANLIAQPQSSSSGFIIDKQTNEPIQHAVVYGNNKTITKTNVEGYFEYKSFRFKDSIQTIDLIGYHPKNADFSDTIKLVPVQIFQDSTVINPKLMVERALNNLATNYGSESKIFHGFYHETIRQKDKVYAYSEGRVRTYKLPYQNGFDVGECIQAQLQESSVLLQGNLKTDLEISLDIPMSDHGYLLPKILDPLSMCSSPLLQTNQKALNFTYLQSLAEIPEVIHIVSFTNEENGISGRIYIGAKSRAIYRVEVKENKPIETLESSLTETASRYTVQYFSADSIFYLGHIIHEKTLFNANNKAETNIYTEYLATNVPGNIDSIPDKLEILKTNQKPEPFLSLQPQLAFPRGQITPRDSDIMKAIGKGERIRFLQGDLEDIIEKSQEEGKLIFINVYQPDDFPSKRMDSTTFGNQAVVTLLNDKFVCNRINLDDGDDYIVYLANLEFIPSYIIMTPLGQIVQVFDGYVDPESLLNTLETYDGFNIDKLFYAYDKRRGSEKKKIESAYLDLFRQLRSLNHPEAPNFIEFFTKPTKNWNSLEAKEVVFEYLIPTDKKKYLEIFYENLDYYESRYGKNMVADKLYQLATNQVFKKGIKKKEVFNQLLQDKAPAYADSLYHIFLIDYYSTLQVNRSAYFSAVIEYLRKYHQNNWSYASLHLITMGFNASIESILQEGLSILDLYEGKVEKYEFLDLKSLFLYRLGEKEKALALIPEIRSLANKKGIIYEVALQRLSGSQKQ